MDKSTIKVMNKTMTGPVGILVLPMLLKNAPAMPENAPKTPAKILHLDSVLSNLLNLAKEHSGKQNGHSMAMLKGISSNPSGVPRSVQKLLEMGLVSEVDKGLYIPTSKGAEYLIEKTSHMGALSK